MTKNELAKFAGTKFYNLSTRPGGKWKTIYCLTIYTVTASGTCKYQKEIDGCIANKKQYAALQTITGGNYHTGRPSAATLTKDFLTRQTA